MKYSKYNILTNYKDYYVIHNLVSEQGILIQKEQNDKFQKLVEKSEPDMNEENVINILIGKGIIIEDDIDEMKVVQKMKRNDIEQKKHRLSITIIPTYQCNFKCIYCWENTKDTIDNMTEQTQNKLLKFIEKKLPESNAVDIDWFGGEPLIALNVVKSLIIEIDKLCNQYKVPYTCSMTTNGYCLTQDVAEFLINYHTHFFQITLDGPAQLHNSNRPLKSGKETFDKILTNLKSIRDNIKTKFIKVLIRLNVTEETVQYADEFIEFVYSEFGSDPRFRMYIQAVERHNDIKLTEMNGKYLSLHNVTEKMYDKCIELGMRTTGLKMLKPGDFMCKTLFENSFFISSDGAVYKCDMDMRKEHISHFGEFKEDGNMVIDPNAKDFWMNEVKESDYCKNCIVYPLCYGLRCPYYNILNFKQVCEQYNDYSLVRNAVKSYAQEGRYQLLEI
ncbi:radical SAM protein [Anaerocolumna sp. AGMB13025]|uniref:radical SAM/SPASM domain-containing protein n=1 Tax=Anaerocolumna sp. AGMB13025 TaxID=3039116 RepID=UPI00241C8243|nr:radical SAM protein [Anaerocolumna sp. AGMB13025]WFR57122.1 radical SAM protein [Anaerocolumna sp. AGMB13025]